MKYLFELIFLFIILIHSLKCDYIEQLESSVSDKTLLQNIKTYLDGATHDKELLNKILMSGKIDGFFSYIQVYGIMQFLFKQYTPFVKGVHSIGQSYQNNPIMAIRIGKRTEENETNSIYSNKDSNEQININQTTLLGDNQTNFKSVVVFTGAHHARELLTQNMVIKICLEHLYNLIHNHMLSYWKFSDVIAIPFVNIDGHMFISNSYDFTSDRNANIFLQSNKSIMYDEYETAKWKRKNMNSSYCTNHFDLGTNIGVDLNRNYGYHWGFSETEDTQECSEIYKGPHPFSEPETKAIKSLVEREKQFIILFLNFHTYGNLWVRPFNFSSKKLLSYFKLDYHVIDFYDNMKKDILQICPHAKVGNAIEMVNYIAKGEASDWLLGEHGIISYSPELGYSNNKFDSFFIHKNLINKALDENFEVVKSMMEKTIFNISTIRYYFDNSLNFVIELDNQSLGKLFNGVIRIESLHQGFLELVDSITLQQEIEQFVPIEYSLLDKDGDLYSTSSDQVKYLEIVVPQLNNLSKLIFNFKLKTQAMSSVDAIHLKLSILFQDLYLLNQFELKMQVKESPTKKIIVYVLISNLVLVIFFFFVKMFCLTNKRKTSDLPTESNPTVTLTK